MLILYAQQDTFVAKVLSTKILVGIGLISYSAYLWHQPIFAFTRIRLFNQMPELLMLALSILALALGYLSWKYIEKPFRNRNFLTQNNIWAGSLAGIFILMSVGLCGKLNQGFPERFNQEVLELAAFKKKELAIMNSSCAVIEGFKQHERCALGNSENIKGVLIGDSHAQMLWKPLHDSLINLNIGMLAFTGGGCPPIFDVYRRDTISRCAEHNQTVFEFIESNANIDFILLSGRWTIHVEKTRFNNQEGGQEPGKNAFLDVINEGIPEQNDEAERQEKLLNRLRESIVKFQTLNRNIFIVYPVPEVGFAPAIGFARNMMYSNNDAELPTHSYHVYLERNQKVRAVFDAFTNNTNIIKFYDVSEDFCNENTGRCITFNDQRQPLYYDDDHLSSIGSEYIVNPFIDWLVSNMNR